MRESRLQAQIIKYLRSQRDYVFNVVGSPYQQKGTPDLFICHNGLFVALECKVGRNTESALQKRERRLISEAGGIADVVRELSEVDPILRLAEMNRGL